MCHIPETNTCSNSTFKNVMCFLHQNFNSVGVSIFVVQDPSLLFPHIVQSRVCLNIYRQCSVSGDSVFVTCAHCGIPCIHGIVYVVFLVYTNIGIPS